MIGDRWGVTDAETLDQYPCDDLLPTPTLRAWRGVSVATPPAAVWPWLVQLRLAPYSYDWIDNLGRRSPRRLQRLDDPAPGDPFSATAGRPVGRILAVEPGRDLTARIMGAAMTYRLTPTDDGCRLLLKILADPPRCLRLALCLADLVMARRQLLNLKALAERTTHT